METPSGRRGKARDIRHHVHVDSAADWYRQRVNPRQRVAGAIRADVETHRRWCAMCSRQPTCRSAHEVKLNATHASRCSTPQKKRVATPATSAAPAAVSAGAAAPVTVQPQLHNAGAGPLLGAAPGRRIAGRRESIPDAAVVGSGSGRRPWGWKRCLYNTTNLDRPSWKTYVVQYRRCSNCAPCACACVQMWLTTDQLPM